jgi:DNA-binding LytR/AlgR family response regulator
MKIGICDDERGTCAELEEMIYRFFSDYRYKLEVDVWYTGEDCIRDMSGDSYDVLFLDIELPGNNGVAVGKYLRADKQDNTVQIIYISSKTNYAMELFQNHPYDFLVKPLTYQRVSDVLGKLLALNESDSRRFRYSQNRVEKSVAFKEIVYLTSRGRYVELHLTSGEVEKYIGRLAVAQKELPYSFVPVSKSYIVNLRYVGMYGSDYIVTVYGEKMSITAPYRNEFKSRLLKYNTD